MIYNAILLQSLLVAQQLASAMSGVMSGGAPGLNQPILIPFNAGGHLGGQQGLVLSLPTAANIQGLVAAAAAGSIMTLPLQNLQGKCLLYTSARNLYPDLPRAMVQSRSFTSLYVYTIGFGVLIRGLSPSTTKLPLLGP